MNTSDQTIDWTHWAILLIGIAVCLRFGFDIHDRLQEKDLLSARLEQQKKALVRGEAEIVQFKRVALATVRLAETGNETARLALTRLQAERGVKIGINHDQSKAPPSFPEIDAPASAHPDESEPAGGSGNPPEGGH